MPDSDIKSTGFLTGFPTREQALAGAFVPRQLIEDGIVPIADLRSDPLWEIDQRTGDFHRRTAEFLSARAETEAALVQQRKDAEIALAAALISLESDLPAVQKDGRPWAIAPNGQPYVIIASDERSDYQHYVACETSAEAIAVWKRKVLKYAATHPGDVLWWRIRPFVGSDVRFGKTTAWWIVYSRLMIGNEADTPLARIAAGALRPTKALIQDNVVTLEQLAELGWVLDEEYGVPVLSKFDAEKVPEAARKAFVAAIESLPTIVEKPLMEESGDISTTPISMPTNLRLIMTTAYGATLADAIAAWQRDLLEAINSSVMKPQWLWWRNKPRADIWFEFTFDESTRWLMTSRCTVGFGPAASPDVHISSRTHENDRTIPATQYRQIYHHIKSGMCMRHGWYEHARDFRGCDKCSDESVIK